MLVYDAFLKWNDSVIRNCNTFRTNFCTTFRYVAIAYAKQIFQFLGPILGVERMHFERRRVNQKPRSDEFLVLIMIPKNVADILAEVTLDAFAKFLHAVYVFLLHSPGAILGIGRPRFELLDAFLDLVI